MLEWCGGQNSKAAVKAVERCKVSWFNDGELEELRKTAAQVTRRDLAREALERRHPELLEYPFYVAAVRKLAGKRLSERPETRELPRLLRDVHLLASALKLDDIDARLRALRQMEALRQLHNQLVEQLLDRHEPLPFSGQERFPAPPLGGSSTIVPIQTLAELEHEGRVMHHCCATYAGLVRDHVSYIYRVLEPERATLELDLTASRPQLVQLRGVGDDPVSRETRQAVLDWYKAGLVEWQPRQEKKRRRKR